MAINLWKIGGQPTSYNPLPSGLNNKVKIPLFNEYVLTFKASSLSGAILRVTSYESVNDFEQRITLTSIPTLYTFSWKETTDGNLYFHDLNSKGDIIIDSIELVKKPLPKLTLNGIDGFTSGKWTLRNSQIVNDYTLSLSTPTDVSELDITVLPNTTYILNGEGNPSYAVYGVITLTYLVGWGNGNRSFNTGNNNIIRIKISNNGLTGTFTFSKPMLTLGSTPIPYEPKRGEQMVLPTPKKNLFDKSNITNGYAIDTGGTLNANAIFAVSSFIPVKPNTNYSKTVSNGFVFYDVNKSFLSGVGGGTTFTTPPNAYYIRFNVAILSLDTCQLEKGTTATSYEPYAVQLNKKPQHSLVSAKTGLQMDGISNYLQLPSMTMDSVEIECLIDSSNNTSPMIVDARTGSTNQLWLGGTSGFTQLLADGVDKALNPLNIPKGQRTKVKVIGSSFTDNITIFANNNGFGSYLKGILYKVTCYLNGSIVAQYDFENPKNIVGNQVLQNAQNLIPSFEDTRWSIHQNAKVMGKDVLHLDATGASQSTKIDNFKVLPNTKYFLTYGGISSGAEMVYAEFNSIGGVVVTNTTIQGSRTITTSATTDYIYILLRNVTTTGSFDFIRPQLYQLSGKEGTINGSPIQQNKARKRTLYAKR